MAAAAGCILIIYADYALTRRFHPNSLFSISLFSIGSIMVGCRPATIQNLINSGSTLSPGMHSDRTGK